MDNLTDTSRLDKPSQRNGYHMHNNLEDGKLGTDPNFKRKIVWFNAIGFLVLHLAALYGLSLILRFKIKFYTILWALLGILLSGEGITMGAHRYYCHRSFKASFTLRLILVLLQTLAGQNCLWVWVRDHRQHHKYSDTDADPHNANRGFFFSHIGWLMSKKHPLVIEKGKNIDMSDLEADPIVMFQKRWYILSYAIIAILIPVAVPVFVWGETWWNSFFVAYDLRNILVLNQTWTVNSIAHLWGNKPFDKNILPSENHFVSAITGGEGWHNFHHTFPWDYRSTEYGTMYTSTTKIIEVVHFLGMATDLKTASHSMIKQRSLRTGDGSHPVYGIKNNRNSTEAEKSDKYLIGESNEENQSYQHKFNGSPNIVHDDNNHNRIGYSTGVMT